MSHCCDDKRILRLLIGTDNHFTILCALGVGHMHQEEIKADATSSIMTD